LLPPPLVGRPAEGAPSPLLFAPQPTLKFEDNVSIDLAEVLCAVEPAIILAPATQYRVEVLNHLAERSPHISAEILANSLPHMLHRLGGGKPVTEHSGSPASGRLCAQNARREYWFSEVLARLWRELHPNAPMQLQLCFRNIGKKDNSKGLHEEATGKMLPLLILPDAHAREPSSLLADRTESSATR
jgi:hypothetical protein